MINILMQESSVSGNCHVSLDFLYTDSSLLIVLQIRAVRPALIQIEDY